MSSRRFPGKVLAPLRGRPLIDHVLEAVSDALHDVPIVVATSTDRSDDPLAAYLRSLNVAVFRGPLESVLKRFQLCAEAYPCEWILRICADSSGPDRSILKSVSDHRQSESYDLITTTFPRSFPKGQNAELIRTSTLSRLDLSKLTSDDLEHVTSFFYRNPDLFRILNVHSGNASLAELSVAVDEIIDLRRLEETSNPSLPELD